VLDEEQGVPINIKLYDGEQTDIEGTHGSWMAPYT
jgi:hypothetical protein